MLGRRSRGGNPGRGQGSTPADSQRHASWPPAACWARNRSARHALLWQPAAHIPSPCSAGTSGVVDQRRLRPCLLRQGEATPAQARCSRARCWPARSL